MHRLPHTNSDLHFHEELNTETFDYYEPRKDFKSLFSKEPIHWIVSYHKDGNIYHYFKYWVLENGEIVEGSLETGYTIEDPKEYFVKEITETTQPKEGQLPEDFYTELASYLLSLVFTIGIVGILWHRAFT